MSVPQFKAAFGENEANVGDRAALQAAIAEAFALLDAAEPDEALARIRGYADLAGSSEIACYVFGLIHFNADHPRDALAWFERALALNGDWGEALRARAIVLQRLGQPEEALDAFEKAVRHDPADADALFSIGVILQSLGRMSEALAAYERALRARPGHCEALTNRGALLERFGRLDEALACFESIAALRPGDPRALFNIGSVLQKLGRHKDALAAYETAAAVGPPDAETELNRGNVLQILGRLEEAIACYDLAARRAGGYPQALYNKGIALHALGRPADALAAYDEALALDPRYCEAICNRGNLLHEFGRLDEAFAAYAEALKIRPSFLPALINRATISLKWGRLDQALRLCEDALRHDPKDPQALGLRGAALHRLGRLGESLDALDRAVALKSEAAEAWLNRGNVLQEMDRLEEAVASYHEALRRRADYPEALSSLGVALKELGDVDAALACFDTALARKPFYADARNNRAAALLLKGRLKEGFEDFDSRWQRSNAPPRPIAPPAPPWLGQDLVGKRILVYDEQGLGDLIQFSRYLPLLEQRGASVDLLCRSEMRRLLATLPGRTRFIDRGDPPASYDFASALLSLPRGFGTELATIPAPRSYLRAEPQAIAAWSARIGVEGFRIGVCWHGNSSINLKRSFPLESLAPVAAIPGVRLIGLVRNEGPVRLETWRGLVNIESLGEDYDAGPDAFLDCAAAMSSLDLVITSDTAIAHLAGALGRPAFLALRRAADWRWLTEREDCPWYPSLRLFRQSERDRWEPVFEKIAAAVSPLAHARREPPGPCGRPVREAAPAPIAIPGAVGELIDKITILEIKQSRIADPASLESVRYELALLRELRGREGFDGADLDDLEAGLKATNETLWDVEDALRTCESRGKFDEEFIALARLVYTCNDRRAAVKRRINQLFQSAIVEEKFYAIG